MAKTLTAPEKQRFYQTLHFQVLVAIIAGVTLGQFYPKLGEQMKPLGDGFIKLIRMMIAPIIFLTVVVGIASVSDLRQLGRVGVQALMYFEVAPTLALVLEHILVDTVPPCSGVQHKHTARDTQLI